MSNAEKAAAFLTSFGVLNATVDGDNVVINDHITLSVDATDSLAEAYDVHNA